MANVTTTWMRFAVDYRQNGIAMQDGTYPTRKAAEKAAALIFAAPGVTAVSVVLVGITD